MTFYEELQLSSIGSKALIKNTTDPKEKRRHILIYNFKVYLVMAFCFVFVTLFSMLFGSDNSVAGVVFLLALLVLRQADFGIRTSHGLICIAGIFTLLITGPRLANTLSTPASLLVNFISILLLMILGCHNVIVQPVHLCFRISSALRLRCYRKSLSSPGTGAACQHDGLYACLLQESKKTPLPA